MVKEQFVVLLMNVPLCCHAKCLLSLCERQAARFHFQEKEGKQEED